MKGEKVLKRLGMAEYEELKRRDQIPGKRRAVK